jgi:hypothetical protein
VEVLDLVAPENRGDASQDELVVVQLRHLPSKECAALPLKKRRVEVGRAVMKEAIMEPT